MLMINYNGYNPMVQILQMIMKIVFFCKILSIWLKSINVKLKAIVCNDLFKTVFVLLIVIKFCDFAHVHQT